MQRFSFFFFFFSPLSFFYFPAFVARGILAIRTRAHVRGQRVRITGVIRIIAGHLFPPPLLILSVQTMAGLCSGSDSIEVQGCLGRGSLHFSRKQIISQLAVFFTSMNPSHGFHVNGLLFKIGPIQLSYLHMYARIFFAPVLWLKYIKFTRW